MLSGYGFFCGTALLDRSRNDGARPGLVRDRRGRFNRDRLDLEVVAEGPSLVVHQTDEVLATMSDFVRELHVRSGLLERIRTSTTTLAEASSQTLAFIEANCPKGTTPLCGNSVWKDRAFLERYMPEIIAYLHYRIIDVSTVKEIVRRWYPAEFMVPKKQERHRALDDVKESIEELKWYRTKVFAGPGGAAK